MAKYNWQALLSQYAVALQQTGVSPVEWCEANNIPFSSAKRYITKKAAKALCDNSQIRNDKIATTKKTAKSQTANKAKTDSRSKKTAKDPSSQPVCDTPEVKLNGRDKLGRFSEGNSGNPNPPANFKPGNQAARKHGGYAARFDDTTLIEESREMSLLDELELCRARALNCIDTMKQIRLDMANATTVEQRIELYNAIASTEQALDRNVVRVESLTRTISSLRIDDVNEVKITKDTDRIEAATDKLRLEADKLAKEGKGNLTPLSGMVASLQTTGNNGFVGGNND